MTPAQLSARLAAQTDSVCAHLLPKGKRAGPEWCVGSVAGEPGQSLKVHLTGERAGVWQDFATSERGGDLLDLWAAVRGIPLKEAMREASAWIGEPVPQWEAKREFTRPAKPKCHKPVNGVAQYLGGRGISTGTLEAYKVGEDGDNIVFPFLRDGELVMAKTRRAADGEAPKPTESGCEKCLFGWQAIPESARDCIITEGEIDALSVYEMGFPAMSVPYGGGGGGKQDWIENEFDHLARFDQIYLCLDRDEVGKEAQAEIIKRLGPERCRIIDIPEPHKDANDLLRAGWTQEQFSKLIHSARIIGPAELKQAADYGDAIVREFYPPATGAAELRLPWEKATTFAFRRGEVVLLGGVNGHGKTEVAGHICLGVLRQQTRACVASMEFKPHKWLKRMTRQAAGLEVPSEGFIRAIIDYYRERLWVFDSQGATKPERILQVFQYAVRRHNIRFFVVDNLAKCGFAEDDYNGQKGFIDQLTDFARDNDVTVLLVAHLRKGRDEHNAGGKMDVKGTGAITDMVDSVLIVWRNKPKEDRARRGCPEADDANAPDAVLLCEKQRNGEDEPRISLWFDRPSHQFLPNSNAHATSYVHYTRGQA